MGTDRMVVVLTAMTFYDHKTEDIVAARFEELGLTAYGRTRPEAVLACKKLFNKFIHTHRNRGDIGKRLDKAGVEWYWSDEYPEDRPEYENTNRLFDNWVTPLQQPQSHKVQLAAAA